MAGVALEITIDDAPVRAMLNRVVNLDSDSMHPALDAIGLAMADSSRRRILETNIGPDGIAWKPSQRAGRTGTKTLVLSHRLELSMTHNVLGAMVEWGTNVIYAALHQLGATFSVFARSQQVYRHYNKEITEGEHLFVKKSRANFASWVTIPQHSVTMPARPFVGFDQEDEAEAYNTLRDFMVRSLTSNAANFVGPV